MSQERENRLQQYLDGRMDAGERERFEQELLADETLMGDAYDEVNVREALAERAHARRMTHKPRRRRERRGLSCRRGRGIVSLLCFRPAPARKGRDLPRGIRTGPAGRRPGG